MSNHHTEIIDQYLKIETNYAVYLTGPYGVGKTHFYKKVLADKIKLTNVPSNEQKKYHPIHISLFGVKSVEDIQSAIFIELHSFLKEKGLKLAIGFGRTLLRGYANLKGLGNIDDYFANLDFPKEQWLNYNELVICFDDLDRKSDELSIQDIMGFINSLVENQGVKIIIIANAKEIEDELTSKIREKVVGVTLQYKPNVSDVFDQIIQERYSSTYNNRVS
jgi:Cdc6-like AAA superfamily ATPase